MRRTLMMLLAAAGILAGIALLPLASRIVASDVVPEVIDQPGSQPTEASPSTTRCENCHGGGYAPAYEPGYNWRGSMMSNATRDPLFYAQLAIAEQDFMPNMTVWNTLNPGTSPGTTPPGGVGDLCIRCHSPEGWMAGHSTPTDASALSPTSDFDGVSCDTCHRMMDPGLAEGRRQVSPGHENYRVDDSGNVEGFYGSGQYVLDPGNDKRGPYDNATSKSHGPIPSPFHRSGDFCGTCHDVSNPAVGHLAPGHGRLDGASLPVDFCLVTKTPCTDDTSCVDCDVSEIVCETTCGGGWDSNTTTCDRRDTCRVTVAQAYPPYEYGIVERTYSEWKSSAWPNLLTGSFLGDASIPADLKVAGGAPAIAANSAPYNSSTDPTYNPPRRFTCQTCHMHSVTGQGCNKNPVVRTDLPLHDQTGGNTWMPSALIYMSNQGTLVGGSLSSEQIDELNAGVLRARAQLRMSVKVDTITTAPGGLDVRVTNLTGHKFLSGYPEGRRAWINVKWYDSTGAVFHEDGAYDAGTAELDEEGTRVYAAHPGMSRTWAETLLAVGYPASFPLAYDFSGSVTSTLGDLASGALGEAVPTAHFVLNDVMIDDHRIPPYGFNPVEAARRNAMPVPADAYPTLPDGTLQYWDDVLYPVPIGAARAEVQVYYQSTSPEFINFLRWANTTNNRGQDLYQAWLNTGMAPPEPLVTTSGSPSPLSWTVTACSGPPAPVGETLALTEGSALSETVLSWASVADATGYLLHRWTSPDGSGTDDSHLLAVPGFTSEGDPPLGETWFFEVGSTNACGETVGELETSP